MPTEPAPSTEPAGGLEWLDILVHWSKKTGVPLGVDPEKIRDLFSINSDFYRRKGDIWLQQVKPAIDNLRGNLYDSKWTELKTNWEGTAFEAFGAYIKRLDDGFWQEGRGAQAIGDALHKVADEHQRFMHEIAIAGGVAVAAILASSAGGPVGMILGAEAALIVFGLTATHALYRFGTKMPEIGAKMNIMPLDMPRVLPDGLPVTPLLPAEDERQLPGLTDFEEFPTLPKEARDVTDWEKSEE